MKKLLFLFLITGFLACSGNSDEEEQRAIDSVLINDYLTANNIVAEEVDGTGVYYRITEEGNGTDYPNINSTIRAFYKGYLLDGTVFDEAVEGEDDELTIELRSLVYGWQVALPKFSKNAKGEIYIPSFAGYGNTEFGGVPKNSVLIFEIDLVNVFN